MMMISAFAGCLKWRESAAPGDRCKYTELTRVHTDDVDEKKNCFKLSDCYYRRYDKTDDIDALELSTDRLILNDSEYIKYEYIHRFVRLSQNELMLVCFGEIGAACEFRVADKHLPVIVTFQNKKDLPRFLTEIFKQILKYKELGTYDKSVKTFKYFTVRTALR